MSIKALIDSGAMGLLTTCSQEPEDSTPTESNPVYNVDRTPNKVGHITEVINLIVQYKDHLE